MGLWFRDQGCSGFVGAAACVVAEWCLEGCGEGEETAWGEGRGGGGCN